MIADFIIVGAGLTGATVARVLADAGREVLVLERRHAVGGNVADTVHESGIRMSCFGPHYFRCNDERLWEWVQRFSPFYKFEAKVQTCIRGQHYRWPLKTTDQHLWSVAVDGYNRKMWGTAPAEATARIEHRQDDSDERLKTDRFQGLPVLGYSGWVQNMLKGIPVVAGFDYLQRRGEVVARKCLVFTGPIDELFGFDLGRLEYRGQKRQTTFLAGESMRQEVVQVNYPEEHVPHLRSIEWNHLQEYPSWRKGSLVTTETPCVPETPDGYEYPVGDDKNRELYGRYRERAKAYPKLRVCGRLGNFRYQDMDAAISHGRKVAEGLLGGAS